MMLSLLWNGEMVVTSDNLLKGLRDSIKVDLSAISLPLWSLSGP